MPLQYELQNEKPLYAKLFWNRPTTKARAGRLLIVGGHRHEFSAVHEIYQAADAAGAGYIQVAMPDTLRQIAGGELGHFLPATQSGSLGKAALGELLHLAGEFDAVVVGGNLTNNAETAILIESLLRKSDHRFVVTQEVIEILKFHPDLITGNPNLVLATTMKGLFDLANNHHIPLAIKPNSGVVGKLEILQQLVDISRCQYVIFDKEVIIAAEGRLSLTPLATELSRTQPMVVGLVATMWLQQPGRPYEALNGAAWVLSRLKDEDLETSASTSAKIGQIFSELEDSL